MTATERPVKGARLELLLAIGLAWILPCLPPKDILPCMKLPAAVRNEFRRHGREGGRTRAARMTPEARRSVARRGAIARWTRERFGEPTFEALGLPGGEIVDAGLADLAQGKETVESLLVSLAAPRLRREGIAVPTPLENPEERLFALLSRTSESLAHARFSAYLAQAASFAAACRGARADRDRRGAR